MDNEKMVYELLKRENGVFTCGQAQDIGISKSVLSDMVKKNILERAAHGQYAAASGKDLNRLYSYAEQFKVTKILRRYMEVLL